MIVLDRLLTGGVRFVLERLMDAAEAEWNDDTVLKEALLDAQMRHELGEIDDEELAGIESEILARMRKIRERQQSEAEAASIGETRVTGAEVSVSEDVTWSDAGEAEADQVEETPPAPRKKRRGGRSRKR